MNDSSGSFFDAPPKHYVNFLDEPDRSVLDYAALPEREEF